MQLHVFYLLDDYAHSTFLQRYNMPLYYATFDFDQGYLVGFQFGFEYP